MSVALLGSPRPISRILPSRLREREYVRGHPASDVPGFIVAEIIGMVAAIIVFPMASAKSIPLATCEGAVDAAAIAVVARAVGPGPFRISHLERLYHKV